MLLRDKKCFPGWGKHWDGEGVRFGEDGSGQKVLELAGQFAFEETELAKGDEFVIATLKDLEGGEFAIVGETEIDAIGTFGIGLHLVEVFQFLLWMGGVSNLLEDACLGGGVVVAIGFNLAVCGLVLHTFEKSKQFVRFYFGMEGYE